MCLGLFFLAPLRRKQDVAMTASNALGTRRRCLSCAGAFYDLGKTPITCPKCAAVFTVVELPRKYNARAAAAPAPVEPAPSST